MFRLKFFQISITFSFNQNWVWIPPRAPRNTIILDITLQIKEWGIYVSGFTDKAIVSEFMKISSGIRITEKHELKIQGVPIFEGGNSIAFEKNSIH